MAGHRRSFGEVSKLPSGRYRARYVAPGAGKVSAPNTFATKGEADRWLTLRRAELMRADWTTTVSGTRTFGDYAETWLIQRQLKPRTRAHYRSLLENQVLPAFASTPVRFDLPNHGPRLVRQPLPRHPHAAGHAYGLLRAILHTAVYDGEISANPAHIRGAGTTPRAVTITPATLNELTTLVNAMPPRRQAMILLAAWCGLRFGEITELRRKDLDLHRGVVYIRRAVIRVDGQYLVTTPKSAAGHRDVALPPHLVPALQHHLDQHTAPAQGGIALPCRRRPHPAPGARQPLQDVLSRPRDRRAARSALARPTPHWRGPRGSHGGDACRADESPWSLHPTSRAAVPARDQRSRCSNRDCPQPACRRRGPRRQRSIGSGLRRAHPPTQVEPTGRVACGSTFDELPLVGCDQHCHPKDVQTGSRNPTSRPGPPEGAHRCNSPP